jgi:hypothetical protein
LSTRQKKKQQKTFFVQTMSFAITAQLLSSLLKTDVASVSVMSIESGTQCVKATVVVDEKETFFLKHFATIESAEDDVITRLHRIAQRQEIAFYRVCGPVLQGKVIPRLIAATDDGVLLLESVQGQFFKMHQSEIDDVTFGRFLSAYVELHSVDAAPLKHLLPDAAVIRANRQQRWVSSARGFPSLTRMQALCDKLRLTPKVTDALLECAQLEYAGMVERLLPLSAPLTRGTLHHGDANPNNLVLREGGRVMLFDFQEPTVDEPALDIAWLTITSLSPNQIRVSHDLALVDNQYALKRWASDERERAAFLKSYHNALTLNAAFIAFLLGPDVAGGEVESWPQRLLHACIAVFERDEERKNKESNS